MAGREALMEAALIELADTLVAEFDLYDYLDILLVNSKQVVDAAAAGVMLSSSGGALELLASTDEGSRVVELFELQRSQGPCVDAYRTGAQVIEDDLARTQRWPAFTPVAVDAGYRAVVALPLRLRGEVLGALNLFRTTAGPAASGDLRAAQALADMATIGILQERAIREARDLSRQLQTALHSRIVIEQAKGVLAERGQVDVDEAFRALRTHARNHGERLHDVASAVVSGALPPEVLFSERT